MYTDTRGTTFVAYCLSSINENFLNFFFFIYLSALSFEIKKEKIIWKIILLLIDTLWLRWTFSNYSRIFLSRFSTAFYRSQTLVLQDRNYFCHLHSAIPYVNHKKQIVKCEKTLLQKQITLHVPLAHKSTAAVPPPPPATKNNNNKNDNGDSNSNISFQKKKLLLRWVLFLILSAKKKFLSFSKKEFCYILGKRYFLAFLRFEKNRKFSS